MRAKRRDQNHSAIKASFERLGFSVFDTASLPHFVDLVVAKHGVTILVEVKNRKGNLTAQQEILQATWRGHIVIVRSDDDIIKLNEKIGASVRLEV